MESRKFLEMTIPESRQRDGKAPQASEEAPVELAAESAPMVLIPAKGSFGVCGLDGKCC
ncbi:hypothetical protein AB4305_15995 [Nocardia sp. 2YAB30]|uniref:hypothetical protein n=1 Tax=unclassified Nocardia TaxID=2637762 RepID=UPI003F9A55AD